MQTLLSWSGGKDSWLALQALNKRAEYEVIALLTTFTEPDNRVAMHGVRTELLEAQAHALNLPLVRIHQPPFPSNDVYEAALQHALLPYQERQIKTVAYGDLFLEDIRQYRDDLMQRLGFEVLYPIWQQDTLRLAQQFIEQAKAKIVCVDTEQIDETFIGQEYNGAFLSALPQSADPCGENGEFHTFVYDATDFDKPLPIRQRTTFMQHDRFLYMDYNLGE